MIDVKGGIATLRTNHAVLAVSGSSVLIVVLIVSYGGSRIIPYHNVPGSWLWPAVVVILGVCGVLLLIAKSVIRPQWLRWLLGAAALLPPLVAGIVASSYLTAPVLAFAMPAFFCAAISLVIDEPEEHKTTRYLIRFLASAACLLLPLMSYVTGSYPRDAIAQSVLWWLFGIGGITAWLHAWRPSSLADRLAGFFFGAVLVFVGFAAASRFEAVTAALCLPTGTILLCLPLFKRYRLGMPHPIETTSEEHRSVR